MTTFDNFIKFFWYQYILIEDEFVKTLKYVALEVDNENAYSNEYAKILLEVGSEVDIVCKEICKQLGKSRKSIVKYGKVITDKYPQFPDLQVYLVRDNVVLSPWESWGMFDEKGNPISPDWWKAYNTIKHDRLGYTGKQNNWTLANQRNTVDALAGLILLELLFYYMVRDEEVAKNHGPVPLPGSRVFSSVTGLFWNHEELSGEYRFYLNDDGILMLDHPLFYHP